MQLNKFDQYQFDDNSLAKEIIDFTVQSLQAVLSLPYF